MLQGSKARNIRPPDTNHRQDNLCDAPLSRIIMLIGTSPSGGPSTPLYAEMVSVRQRRRQVGPIRTQ